MTTDEAIKVLAMLSIDRELRVLREELYINRRKGLVVKALKAKYSKWEEIRSALEVR